MVTLTVNILIQCSILYSFAQFHSPGIFHEKPIQLRPIITRHSGSRYNLNQISSLCIRHGINSILSIPIPLNSVWSIPIPPQIDQFQFNFNSKFFNSNSGFFRLFFCLILYTMSRYSENLLGIHNPSSLYSK